MRLTDRKPYDPLQLIDLWLLRLSQDLSILLRNKHKNVSHHPDTQVRHTVN